MLASIPASHTWYPKVKVLLVLFTVLCCYVHDTYITPVIECHTAIMIFWTDIIQGQRPYRRLGLEGELSTVLHRAHIDNSMLEECVVLGHDESTIRHDGIFPTRRWQKNIDF